MSGIISDVTNAPSVSLMMGKTFLAVSYVLLSTGLLAAQPTIGTEVVSDVLENRNELLSVTGPAVAMARDRQGLAMAWTMRHGGTNRIYVARLAEDGRISGPIIEIPGALTEASDAYLPSVAASPTGSGFLLAWLEASVAPNGGWTRVVYSVLDGELRPSSPKVLTLVQLTSGAPVIARSGKAAWVAAGGVVWQILPDGSAARPIDAGLPAADMTGVGDFPKLVAGARVSKSWTCSDAPGCRVHSPLYLCYESCRIYQYAYELHYVALYTASGKVTFPFDSDAQPAVQSDGVDTLIVWFDGSQSRGGVLLAARLRSPSLADFENAMARPFVLGNFGPDGGPLRPEIATDGERYLVVWRTTTPGGDHDIVGASVDRAGKVTDLSIASSSANEKDPSVISLSRGTFLVAYEKVSNGQRRIAGRVITFGNRRRTVH